MTKLLLTSASLRGMTLRFPGAVWIAMVRLRLTGYPAMFREAQVKSQIFSLFALVLDAVLVSEEVGRQPPLVDLTEGPNEVPAVAFTSRML